MEINYDEILIVVVPLQKSNPMCIIHSVHLIFYLICISVLFFNIPVGFIYPHYLCQMPFLRVLLYFGGQHCFNCVYVVHCLLFVRQMMRTMSVTVTIFLCLTNEKCSPRSVSVAVMLEFVFALLRFGCNL